MKTIPEQLDERLRAVPPYLAVLAKHLLSFIPPQDMDRLATRLLRAIERNPDLSRIWQPFVIRLLYRTAHSVRQYVTLDAGLEALDHVVTLCEQGCLDMTTWASGVEASMRVMTDWSSLTQRADAPTPPSLAAELLAQTYALEALCCAAAVAEAEATAAGAATTDLGEDILSAATRASVAAARANAAGQLAELMKENLAQEQASQLEMAVKALAAHEVWDQPPRGSNAVLAATFILCHTVYASQLLELLALLEDAGNTKLN